MQQSCFVVVMQNSSSDKDVVLMSNAPDVDKRTLKHTKITFSHHLLNLEVHCYYHKEDVLGKVSCVDWNNMWQQIVIRLLQNANIVILNVVIRQKSKSICKFVDIFL